MRKTISLLLATIMFVSLTTFSSFAGDSDNHKGIKNIEIVKLAGVKQIPVELLVHTDGLNFFNINVTYNDGTKTKMTMLDKADGESLWLSMHYEDEETEDEGIKRTYYFDFYFNSLVKGSKPVASKQESINFAPIGSQDFKSSFNKKLKVTKRKNWQIINFIPNKTGMYRLSKLDNEKVKLYVLGDDKIIEAGFSDQFKLTKGNKYSILLKYDISDNE